MHPSVRAAWRAFNQPLEGVVAWMYQDVRGLVTTGMGCLIDPVETAIGLPWRHKDGRAAGELAIRGEWHDVKTDPTLARSGARAAMRITSLRLDDDAIDALIAARLDAAAAELQRHAPFAQFEGWPADAQMAVLSMAWALGPGFGPHWPRFSAACAAGDWSAAAGQCAIDTTGNPGVVPRNTANKQCLLAASAVVAFGQDPQRLWWPRTGPSLPTGPGTPWGAAAR